MLKSLKKNLESCINSCIYHIARHQAIRRIVDIGIFVSFILSVSLYEIMYSILYCLCHLFNRLDKIHHVVEGNMKQICDYHASMYNDFRITIFISDGQQRSHNVCPTFQIITDLNYFVCMSAFLILTIWLLNYVIV